jgi:hypothetical protein
MTYSHGLHTSPLFSDAGLADLLDRYPRSMMNVYTMGSGTTDRETFRRGEVGALSGAELLETVKRGRLWINLRQTNHHDPAMTALCDVMFAELEAGHPGVRTLKRDLGILISSPRAQVYYHLDIPLVTLWQIRGVKRAWVYPVSAPYIGEEALERIVLKETEEEFDFDPAFDNGAQVFDLNPGEMLTWPQNAPHRIVNHDMLNVSLSVEFMTVPALVRANAIYTNGLMRRQLGLRPQLNAQVGLGEWAKAGVARGLKAVRAGRAYQRPIRTTFRVDPTAEQGFRDISA